MSSVLVFGDIHIDNYKPFSKILENGLNSRLVAQTNVIKAVRRLARKHDAIVFLGDFFNSKAEAISKILYVVAYYLVQTLTEEGKPLYMLVGNHDMYRDVHVLTPFEAINNVHIVSSTVEETIGGMPFVLVPWGGAIPAPNKDKILLGHFGISGATVGNDVFLYEEVSKEAISGFKYALCGHYHTRQMLLTNVGHIGAVMARSFSDTDEDKGVTILSDEGPPEFIPIRSPKFITMEAEEGVPITIPDPYNYYRVIVRSEAIEVPSLPDNAIVEYDIPNKASDREAFDLSVSATLDRIIDEFIDKSNTVLDKELLKTRAHTLLDQGSI